MLDRWMAVASPFAFAALCWLCLTDRAPSPSAAAAASASADRPMTMRSTLPSHTLPGQTPLRETTDGGAR